MIFVFIVGSVRVYREALAGAFEKHDEIRVIGLAAAAHAALRPIRDLGPDIVLVDMSAPHAIAAARTLSAVAPAKIVALAAPENEQSIVACAEAGVAAFVSSEATFDDVVTATEAVVRGETVCSPRVAATLLRRVANDARARQHSEFAPLTLRERQVVALIDEGLSNKEIAAELSIELSTVKNHVHHLLEKLGARGRGEAAARMRMVG
ncbi:MAG: LuxR C-terminal-related transcriptional regulator [Solirubrobacteraceae bacterium]